MKIILSTLLIFTMIGCSNSPEEKWVVDTIRVSNQRLNITNEDNLRFVKVGLLQHPESFKLDSIYQLIYTLRSKSTELKRLISEEPTPNEAISEELLDFENYINSLNLKRAEQLKIVLPKQGSLQNQLFRLSLINQILNIENIAQDELRSSCTIADFKLLPYVDYTINNLGQDSVRVNLSSLFFQRTKDLDIEVMGKSPEDYQMKRIHTFSQLVFSDSTFHENDTLTIKVVGKHLMNYFDTTVKIKTSGYYK